MKFFQILIPQNDKCGISATFNSSSGNKDLSEDITVLSGNIHSQTWLYIKVSEFSGIKYK